MRLLLLGTAQDGGVPHVGCRCHTCEAARADPSFQRLAPSAAVVDSGGGKAWLLDASPDLPEQMEAVREALGSTHRSGVPFSAILITHLHMGHYWGLGHLGKEGMMPRGLLVLAPPQASRFLRRNRPFMDLMDMGALDYRAVRPGESIPLAEDLTVTARSVLHREDVSDTVAWEVRRPRSRVLYAPDMDVLDDATINLVTNVDIALLDGTFYSTDEIPDMMRTVPHPPVSSTVETLRGAVEAGTRVIFTHLNHTNPLCDIGSVETASVIERGFEVASDGMTIDI
jgi:pyrroloquinoline quinone biosynthesis protein B